MEFASNLRWVLRSRQRAPGNKSFDVNFAKQRQIGGRDPTGNRQFQTNIRKRLHARQVCFSPLLSAGLSIAATMVNRLANTNAIPVAGIIQRPVAEQLHLNFAAAGLRDAMTFLYRRQRRSTDNGHPVCTCSKGLLREGFARIGHFPVGDDDFIRALGTQCFHGAQPFG